MTKLTAQLSSVVDSTEIVQTTLAGRKVYNVSGEMYKMAKYANSLLNDPEFFVRSTGNYYDEAFSYFKELNGRAPKNAAEMEEFLDIFIEKKATDLGFDFKKIPPSCCSPEKFQEYVGTIFLDTAFTKKSHASQSHAIQMLALIPEIERKFGVGKAKEFFMGMKNKPGLWQDLFDAVTSSSNSKIYRRTNFTRPEFVSAILRRAGFPYK